MSSVLHIYIDLDVTNDDLNPTSQPPALSFEVTRNHALLEGKCIKLFCNYFSLLNSDWIIPSSFHSVHPSESTICKQNSI